jgi:N-methylhydantoinase B
LRRKIAALPDGVYRNRVRLPKIPNTEQRVDIEVAVHVKGDEILLDYTGTSGEVSAAINCTLTMTKSYSCYPIKLALDPEVPNNAGALQPVSVKAEEGSVVHCRHPAATWGRTMISHLFPEIIFGALEPLLPEYVLAGNGGCPANEMYLHGRKKDGRSFMAISAHMGGFGGSARQDGPSTLCFPNNTRNIPVEVTENEATMIYTRKELVRDSAGAGRFRGGFGQEVEFYIPDGDLGPQDFVASSVRLSGRSPESDFPVNGRLGGKNAKFYGLWHNDAPVEHGVYRRLLPGDRIRFMLSGGGGYGSPLEREPERVRDDVIADLVSIEAARHEYGVIIDPVSLQIDAAKTRAERARRTQAAP